MSLHHLTHPEFVEGCAPCRWTSVAFAPSALGSPQAATFNRREAQKKADMDAYPRLLRDGVQPMHVDGAARMEREAVSRFEIESGQLLPNKTMAREIDRRLADV